MEYILGGTAASIAGAICNPLEVVKIRLQLQGELLARGKYAVHYKNAFHAMYTIGSKEGMFALQKGMIPFMLYQFSFNSIRLGLYQVFANKGWNKGKNGKVHKGKTMFLSSCSGVLGGVVCTPFYLVKTLLQSKANVSSIAVGHQHEHTGLIRAMTSIVRTQGVLGLWRGTSGNLARLSVGSGIQILTFEASLEYMRDKFPGKTWTSLALASFTSGLIVSLTMAPVDLVATRFFNQGTNAAGKGLAYSSIVDCTVKVFKSEGFLGFFKGWTAGYFRMGPHTIICLPLWDRLKHSYHQHQQHKLQIVPTHQKLLTR